MNVFPHLNYRYAGTPNTAWSHVSQPPQLGATRRIAEDVQTAHNQHHLGDGYMRSDSSRILQAGLSSDSTASHRLLPQHNNATVGPRGAVHSDPTGPTMIRCVNGSSDLSDQYVPSSGDKITCADHRPLDEIFNVRPSSSYPQTKSGPIYPSHNGTQRGHPRHTSVLTYPLPDKPQLDGVVQIPLLAVDNQTSGTGLVIDFRRSDWGIGVRIEGMPMLDLLHGNISDLEDPYRPVLDGFGLTDLRLNILWPHYPPHAKVISAFGIDGTPITRSKLGYEVALAFAEFFYYMTLQAVSPVQPGPYTIVSSYAGSSSPGITFNQLHLIAVRNTSHGEWMAEVRAITMFPEREGDV